MHGPIRFLFGGPGHAPRGNIGQKHELEKLFQPLSEEDKALNQSQVMSRLCLPLCDPLPTMILPLAVGRRAKCPPSTEVCCRRSHAWQPLLTMRTEIRQSSNTLLRHKGTHKTTCPKVGQPRSFNYHSIPKSSPLAKVSTAKLGYTEWPIEGPLRCSGLQLSPTGQGEVPGCLFAKLRGTRWDMILSTMGSQHAQCQELTGCGK